MANPSANNNGSTSNRNTTTTSYNIINSGRSAVPENSPVGRSERALKHKISFSKDWTPDEQSLLEELLTKYASDSKLMRYAKIAPRLQGKTVRDVALRYMWMTEKFEDQQVESSSHATNHSSDDDITYEEIGGESGQLVVENVKAMKQISANFSASKLHENINLLSKIRNNITALLKKSSNDMCEMEKKMPPLPFKLDDKLANSVISPSTLPIEL